MTKRRVLLICLSILLAAVVLLFLIFSTEPTAHSEAATKKSAMLVEVIAVEQGDFYPLLSATGTVLPVEDVMLSPLVPGQIIRRSPAFIPGGFVEKGDLLLQIDPSDYRNLLEQRKSELQQAQTAMAMEMGRQGVAQQDLQLAGVDSLSTQEQALVLRQPQLEAAKAQVSGARAAVSQAETDLSRTSIRAPFDAHVLQQNVTVGAQVAPGDDLGRLVGSDYYWVSINLPIGQLRWLHFPVSEQDEGSPVKLRNNSWPLGSSREGRLYRKIGALNEETRLARVLVRISDPLASKPESEDLPPLMIGSFVEAQVQGTQLVNVVRLPRELVRRNNTVWVMKDEKLTIRELDILLTDSRYAYISQGLKGGEMVVTTNLSTVVEGIPLRLEEMGTKEDTENNE